MILYDNIEDANGKLAGTICLLKGKPVLVREVCTSDEDPKAPYTLLVQGHRDRNYIKSNIDDPNFSFKDFNLGYANQGSYACWWFRKPMKQFRQGLRIDQMSLKMSRPELAGHFRWEFGLPIVKMLENNYPPIEECAKALRDQMTEGAAFHKDVALSFDRIHQDYLVEYRGSIVGNTADLKTFTLLNEYKYLTEAIQEATK